MRAKGASELVRINPAKRRIWKSNICQPELLLEVIHHTEGSQNV